MNEDQTTEEAVETPAVTEEVTEELTTPKAKTQAGVSTPKEETTEEAAE